MERQEYQMTHQVYEVFMTKLEELNKKAKRLKFPAIEVNIINTVNEVDDVSGEVTIQYTVEVIGDSPRLNGWEFVATLQHVREEGQNIVHVREGQELPERFRTASSRSCEHCNNNRFRVHTYVLRNVETGEYKQIGKTCLKDFLGHSNPHTIAKYADWLADVYNAVKVSEDDYADESYGSILSLSGRFYDLKRFLEVTAQMISQVGFVSRRMANESEYPMDTTADRVWNELHNTMLKKEQKVVQEITDENKELVVKVIEWAKSLGERDNLSDYLYNLHVLATNNIVDYKSKGLGASMITAYLKEVEGLKAKERQKKVEQTSEYFGTVSKREVFKLTVEKVILIESFYGITKLHRMVDENGNVAVWFSSNKELEEGKTYSIKGTVKEHSEYNNVKQTVLTRCNVC